MTRDTTGGSTQPKPTSGACPGCSLDPGQAQEWPRALARKIAVAMVFKLTVLGGLWWWFFSAAHGPDARGRAVAQHLLPGSENPQ